MKLPTEMVVVSFVVTTFDESPTGRANNVTVLLCFCFGESGTQAVPENFSSVTSRR